MSRAPWALTHDSATRVTGRVLDDVRAFPGSKGPWTSSRFAQELVGGVSQRALRRAARFPRKETDPLPEKGRSSSRSCSS